MTRHRIPVDQWRDPRQRLGVWGEQIALAVLTANGWIAEAHRFRVERHDIDLIVRRGHLVAFVEVKTRRTTTFGRGVEAVDWRKRRVIAQVAAVWRLRYGRPEDSFRFDVIGIQQVEPGQLQIEHLEDAWRCGRF